MARQRCYSGLLGDDESTFPQRPVTDTNSMPSKQEIEDGTMAKKTPEECRRAHADKNNRQTMKEGKIGRVSS